jgi:2-polyprenyl-6-methoxyphenol hydroxylase-like FAD-dependent oxidoreductase
MDGTATPSHQHAVVLGASMAGLLAARVLRAHFARVTIVERDQLPATAEFRKGVPQSRHLHVLLGHGADLLERLFPGLRADLRAAGAEIVHWPRDVLLLTRAGWSRRFAPGVPLISCSRELLEWHVRQRVSALTGLTLLQAHDATGLVANAVGTAIAGVRVHARPAAGDPPGDESVLAADLVVDASGRDSHTPHWLETLGYPPPMETRITSFLGYASRYYAPPPDHQANWRALFLTGKPLENPRGGGLFPIEGGRWLVTLAGLGHDYPPLDDTGFLEFARSLRSTVLYEAIRGARPLTPAVGYRRTENQLRHYERLTRFPERLVVLGDAVCAFNPIYGQGMTVAAQAAVVLHQTLRVQAQTAPAAALEGLGRRFQARLARRNATAWLMATGEDLRYPTTIGARPDLATRLLQRYFDRLIDVAAEHPGVNRAFLEVSNLRQPPSTLFKPSVVLPVLRGRTRPPLDTPPAPLSLARGA